MISIIDPNNRDYDFCHNRTALEAARFIPQREKSKTAAQAYTGTEMRRGH